MFSWAGSPSEASPAACQTPPAAFAGELRQGHGARPGGRRGHGRFGIVRAVWQTAKAGFERGHRTPRSRARRGGTTGVSSNSKANCRVSLLPSSSPPCAALSEAPVLAHATAATLRLKLLKIGARVTVAVRRVKVAMDSAHPRPSAFVRVDARWPGWNPTDRAFSETHLLAPAPGSVSRETANRKPVAPRAPVTCITPATCPESNLHLAVEASSRRRVRNPGEIAKVVGAVEAMRAGVFA